MNRTLLIVVGIVVAAAAGFFLLKGRPTQAPTTPPASTSAPAPQTPAASSSIPPAVNPPANTANATSTPSAPSQPSAQPTVQEFTITAKQWEFQPSTITVKKGQLVRLHIKSIDVTHGFSVSDFGVNATLTPNQTRTVEFTPDKVGNFSFACSVFCGSGHSGMRGTLQVTE